MRALYQKSTESQNGTVAAGEDPEPVSYPALNEGAQSSFMAQQQAAADVLDHAEGASIGKVVYMLDPSSYVKPEEKPETEILTSSWRRRRGC
jgi:hypothetical protein